MRYIRIDKSNLSLRRRKFRKKYQLYKHNSEINSDVARELVAIISSSDSCWAIASRSYNLNRLIK